MSEMIRSFIAFDINNESVLNRFSKALSTLVDTGADLNLVKPENIHITMRFLGNIAASMIDPVYEEMRRVSFEPFNMEIRGLGAFPSLNYVRVVWAGIRKGAQELRNVFNQLEPNLRTLGFKPDTRGFSPHITIARVRTGRNKSELLRCIKNLTDYEFGTIKADYLKLKKSVLTPKGPIYSTLHEVSAVKIN